jgi:hypothetical protein
VCQLAMRTIVSQPNVLGSLILAAIAAAVISIVLYLRRKGRLNSRRPKSPSVSWDIPRPARIGAMRQKKRPAQD